MHVTDMCWNYTYRTQEGVFCSFGQSRQLCAHFRRGRVPPGSPGVMFVLLSVGPHSAVWSKRFSGSLATYERVNIEEGQKQTGKHLSNIRPDRKGKTSVSATITWPSLFEESRFRFVVCVCSRLLFFYNSFMFELYHISRSWVTPSLNGVTTLFKDNIVKVLFSDTRVSLNATKPITGCFLWSKPEKFYYHRYVEQIWGVCTWALAYHCNQNLQVVNTN